MTVLFRDDFNGPGTMNGRTTMGFTWSSGSSETLTGVYPLGNTDNSRLTMAASTFVASTGVIEVEFAFTSTFGRIMVDFCGTSWAGSTYPNNPGMKVNFDKYYGNGVELFSADTMSVVELASNVPSTVVGILRMEIGTPYVEVFMNGDSLGVQANNSLTVMGGVNQDMVLKIETLFAFGSTMDYVEVRDDNSPSPPTVPFWTDFVGSREVL